MSRTDRYIWIDSLKGISILGVVMIHSGAMAVDGIIGMIGRYGSSFVQAFFVISAFLVWKSLDKYETELDFFSGIKWVFGKLLAIIPMYYLSIILSIVFVGGNQYWAGDINPLSATNVLAHLLFLHGFFPKYCNSIIGVEWYLGVLAIFYFAAVPLHKYVNSLLKSVLFFVLTMIICNYICSYATSYYHTNEFSYIYQQYYSGFGFVAQIPSLALGVILYYLLQLNQGGGEANDRPYVKMTLSSLSVILALAVFKASFSFMDLSTKIALTFFIYGIGQSIYAIPIFNNKFFSLIGKHSLGIYLFHYLIIFFVDAWIRIPTSRVSVNWGIKYVVVVCISLGVSIAISKMIGGIGSTRLDNGYE